METTELACDYCGKKMVEETPEGLYCRNCQRSVNREKRAVHHEGFPHVVSEDEEP